jgi:uncharacterized protein (DUF433 family)
MDATLLRLRSAAVVSRNPEVHSGDLVFAGTRVPVSVLLDYVKGGSTVEEFLEGHPTVERWQVEALLDLGLEAIDPGKPE